MYMCYVTMGEHFFMKYSTNIYLVITGTKLIDFPAYNFNMFVSVNSTSTKQESIPSVSMSVSLSHAYLYLYLIQIQYCTAYMDIIYNTPCN